MHGTCVKMIDRGNLKSRFGRFNIGARTQGIRSVKFWVSLRAPLDAVAKMKISASPSAA